MKTKYRADIDGLRAVAVLSVVLDHAGVKLFSGGYIGVDVFFVISGYLITTIIAQEIELNEFSILKFYERRIRRIFPALFTILAATCLLSLWLYKSNDLLEFSKSLLATTLFYSNFLFWSQAGYFDAPSLLKPLLHTWSLAVEEQFYIVFPMLLFGLYRYARPQLKRILVLIAVLSLALSVYGVYGLDDGRSTAFYLLHMRAWELLFGSLIALGIFPVKPATLTRNLIALTGFALIGIPIFYYNNETLFPGLAAIPPVLGTGLIIWVGENNADSPTFVSRLLSIPPLVFVGLISYSLYLWHWPILVFARYVYIVDMGLKVTFYVLLAIFLLSIFSWWFIERPFRFKASLNRQWVYRFATAGMLVFILFGFTIYKSEGFSSIAYFRSLDQTLFISKECDLKPKESTELNPNDLCELGNEGGAPSFFVWGDSHARASGYGMHLSAKKMGLTGDLAFANGCPPIILYPPQNKCHTRNEQIVQYITAHDEIKTVILDARWTQYSDRRRDELFSGLEESIKRLTGVNKRVVIVLPTPEMKYDVPSTYFIALRRGLDINRFAGESTQVYLKENNSFLKFTDDLVEKYGVTVVEPSQVLCDEKLCPAVMAGNILYVDTNHMSNFAAELVAPLFDPAFEDLKNNIK